MDISNIKVLGTSHISPESIDQVKKTIYSYKPDIIALELDKSRLIALLHGERKIKFKDILSIGFKGYIFAKIAAWGSKKLGNIVGTTPGDEMKAAVLLARKKKIRLGLIDQHVQITLRKFSKAITWKEKFRFLWDIISSPFQKKFSFDLKAAPSEEIVEKLTAIVRDRYPSVYRVLIEERNIIMARNLAHLIKANPHDKIFVIVGAGHKKEIIRLLKTRFD